ncbi:DNA polymerase III subunit chi [Shimia biformata]|uniref:DNA polymerase III subunit chi n=1 Tax=Shimia biformata TaxID=1294299 RepID=UPI001950A658|nr:DNA polymerase III subunit chi [Shimia biformata]
MGDAFFYHLTRNPVETTLATLLERSRAAGMRVLVRGRDAERMNWLDEKLWLGPEDAFLAHGLSGGPHDADQPILLTTADGNPNGANCLMVIDGAEVSAEEVQAADRVCILFDGHDEGAVGIARTQWKGLTDAGCAAKYWSEESGRWEMKAQHPKG